MDIRKKTAWELAPYLKQEGIFEGRIIRIKSMNNASGCLILFRTAEKENPVRSNHSLLPMDILSAIYKEQDDANGSVIFGIYCSGWKYRDEENGESSIEELLSHLRPGQFVRIRMSKNWKGNRYYCRYIENEDTCEWSGHADEADWRQEEHPYNYFQKSGSQLLKISHIEPYTDDFEKRSYSLEVSEARRGDFGIWRISIPYGSNAAKIIRMYEKSESGLTDIKNREILCDVSIDEETGKSYITEINMSLPDIKKAKSLKSGGRKRISNTGNHNYAAIKHFADNYFNPLNDEYDTTGGQYKATVLASDLIDYRRADIPFIPLLLSDGRTIMPEIRSSVLSSNEGRKLEIENAELLNLIRNKKYLYPGEPVIVYFGKNRRSDRMSVKGLYAAQDKETVIATKQNWLISQEEERKNEF